MGTGVKRRLDKSLGLKTNVNLEHYKYPLDDFENLWIHLFSIHDLAICPQIVKNARLVVSGKHFSDLD